MSTRLRTSATVLAIAMALTACGGDSDSDTGTDTGTDTATDAATDGTEDDMAAPTTLDVTGTDQLGFDPATLSATAGDVTFTLTSQASVNHSIVIEELDDAMVVEAAAGATESGTVTLDAGTYTFYCDVPGHRAAGMEGSLTVS